MQTRNICRHAVFLASLCCLGVLLPNPAFAELIDVFILAGQSNASGRTLPGELSTALDSHGVPYNSYAANDDSMMYAHRELRSADNTVVHDQSFGDLRVKSPYLGGFGLHGAELSLARDLSAASDRSVAFLKFTVGGTGIHRWLPSSGDLYQLLMEWLTSQQTALIAEGYDLRWKGAFWVQGESDATAYGAPPYVPRFTTLFDSIRNDLDAANMPIVMAPIKSNLVDTADFEFSKNNPHAALINTNMTDLADQDSLLAMSDSTNDLSLRDGIHYTADSYIELGHRLADTYQESCFLCSDFNDDAFVDMADFPLWATAYGDAGTTADADHDGDSDGADFLVWQRQYTGSNTALITVPEPSGAAILLGCLVCAAHKARNSLRTI